MSQRLRETTIGSIIAVPLFQSKIARFLPDHDMNEILLGKVTQQSWTTKTTFVEWLDEAKGVEDFPQEMMVELVYASPSAPMMEMMRLKDEPKEDQVYSVELEFD